jgi:hypothetical protein
MDSIEPKGDLKTAMIDGRPSLRHKLHRFRSRPSEDRRLILRAATILPLTMIGLRLFGFRRWKEWVEKMSQPAYRAAALPSDSQLDTAMRAARAVRSAQLHGPISPNCLERSLTLWWILLHEGVHGELHIGARKQDGQLEAHAWVELDGRILNDEEEVREEYAQFDAPIAAVAGRTPAGKTISD